MLEHIVQQQQAINVWARSNAAVKFALITNGSDLDEVLVSECGTVADVELLILDIAKNPLINGLQLPAQSHLSYLAPAISTVTRVATAIFAVATRPASKAASNIAFLVGMTQLARTPLFLLGSYKNTESLMHKVSRCQLTTETDVSQFFELLRTAILSYSSAAVRHQVEFIAQKFQ